MLEQETERNSSSTRLDECPFCGADLTACSTASHLEECDEFYYMFDKEPPESADSESSQREQDPIPEYSEASMAALNQARDAGKWIGRAPAGFEVVDGYLQVNDEEFTAIAEAFTRVADGESLWSVSRDVDPVHGSTLRRIHSDDDRRRVYVEQRADDQRIQTALDEWNENAETTGNR